MSDTTLILFLIVFLPMVIFLNPYLEKNSKKKILETLRVILVLLVLFFMHVLVFGEQFYREGWE